MAFDMPYGSGYLKIIAHAKGRDLMRMKLLVACMCVAPIAMPLTASAQGGVPGGAAHGFYEGGRIAGPIGAVVGTAVGGVVGGVEGVLGMQPYYVGYREPHYYRGHRTYHRRYR
jgi:hypothetical protein